VKATESQAVGRRIATRELCSARRDWHQLALNAFLTALDPRGESKESKAIRFSLACSRDIRFPEFLERLYQPRYRRWSLAAIVKSCDISLGEFLAFWQNAQVERAIAIAYRAAPAVVAAKVSAALGREVVCNRCDGLGWVEIVGIAALAPPDMIPGYLGRVPGHSAARRTCPKCDGSGKMREPPNLRACEKVLEIAGLIGRRSAVRQVITYDYGSELRDAEPDHH